MKFKPTNSSSKKSLTTIQVIIRILCIELLMEFSIMLLLRAIPHQRGTYIEAAADTLLLVILTTPAIYFFVIKPFVEAHAEAVIEINHLTHTDSLTKLANRRLILEYLEVMLASHAAQNDFGAALLIDLDGFKPINDAHGHDAGDMVLVRIGERLKNSVRGEDVVARLGGDEYLVLLRKLGTDEKVARYVAQLVAYKLIKEVMGPVDFNGNSLQVGASVGIRIFGVETDSHKIISDADAAMYRAKDNGKGCAVFFDE